MTDHAEFAQRTAPYRRELLAHCYRMLGSVDDAEDLVQETMLRAWRAYDDFEGRSSLRTWLYRIATNACLNALEHSSRRVLPSGLAGPAIDSAGVGDPSLEVPWLQPIPQQLIAAETTDPAAIVAARDGLRLALVAAWQHLPPRQRAILILRDVLHWKAAEVAELIGVSVAAVHSSLQRAHATLARVTPETELAEPDDPRIRSLLDRYATAFEEADMDTLTELLKSDAVWEMPPLRQWFRGAGAIVELITVNCGFQRGEVRMVETVANGQPAFGFYRRGEAHSIQVLSVDRQGVGRVVSFLDPALFDSFGLPKTAP